MKNMAYQIARTRKERHGNAGNLTRANQIKSVVTNLVKALLFLLLTKFCVGLCIYNFSPRCVQKRRVETTCFSLHQNSINHFYYLHNYNKTAHYRGLTETKRIEKLGYKANVNTIGI